MAAEPPMARLATMATVADILDWVPVASPVREAMLGALGLQEGSPVRILAGIDEEDVLALRSSLRIDGQPLTPAAKGIMGITWKTARLAAGLEKSREQVENEKAKVKEEALAMDRSKLEVLRLQAQASASGSGTSSGKAALNVINLAEVLDQTRSGTVPRLSNKEIIDAHAVYEDKMEGECPGDERPTDDQISAVVAVLAEDDNAYPDFAIFGPHGNRMLRKLSMSGLIPSGVGCFRRVEIRGPPDIYTWTRSFMVWRYAGHRWCQCFGQV